MKTGVKDIIKEMNKFGKNRIPFLFIINFDMTKAAVYCMPDALKNSVLFNVNGLSNDTTNQNDNSGKMYFEKKPPSYSIYKTAFEKARREIAMGNTYLINLTFKTRIQTSPGLREIYNRVVAKYKLLYKDEFVVFSPETFVSITQNSISSFPMKGTIDAGLPDAEARLLSDPKEKAEHNTIVDLIRNDLSMVSKNVRVEKFRYIERIKTHEKDLLQTSTRISGDLDSIWNERIGDILFTLLPAGSVTGAPKARTVEIIRDTENYDRGFYTGIFGFFDGSNLDSAVMIRFIEKTSDGMFFKSGGGITCFSDCRSEYQELIDKVYLPVG